MLQSVLPVDEAVERLRQLGHFGDPEDPRSWSAADVVAEDPQMVASAVTRFQRYHGLEPDGILGPVTRQLLQSPYRCGLPDFMAQEARTCQWPMKHVTYAASVNLRGLTADEANRAFDEACGQWNAVCGLQLTRVADLNKANIYAQSGRGNGNNLDGAGGTLAWSYLPCGANRDTRLRQMYDEDERWIYPMAVAVICHEIGHAIGLSHSEAGQLMAPYYSAKITKPQASDIAEVVKRYGQPAVKPADPPKPPPAEPPDSEETVLSIQIPINGTIFAGAFRGVLVERSGR